MPTLANKTYLSWPDKAVLERNRADMLCRAPTKDSPVSTGLSSTCCSNFFSVSSNLWRLTALL